MVTRSHTARAAWYRSICYYPSYLFSSFDLCVGAPKPRRHASHQAPDIYHCTLCIRMHQACQIIKAARKFERADIKSSWMDTYMSSSMFFNIGLSVRIPLATTAKQAVATRLIFRMSKGSCSYNCQNVLEHSSHSNGGWLHQQASARQPQHQAYGSKREHSATAAEPHHSKEREEGETPLGQQSA